MQITVTTLRGEVFSLEVPEDLELENFKAFCEAESGLASKEMIILYNGLPLLDDKKPMKEYGVKNGDMVVMEKVRKEMPKPAAAPQGAGGGFSFPDFGKIKIPKAGQSSSSSGGAGPSRSSQEEDPNWIREMLKTNPDQLALLKQNNPRLADALESGPEEFAKVRKNQSHFSLNRNHTIFS